MTSDRSLNILTGILAGLLCLFFVAVAFGAVLSGTVAASIKSNHISKIVRNIDYTSEVIDNDTLTAVLEAANVDKKLADNIMKSDMMQKIVGTYAHDLAASLLGKEQAGAGFTPENIKKIAYDNMDELVGIMKKSTKAPVSDEMLRRMIEASIDQNAEKIAEILPPVETVFGQVNQGTSSVLRIVFDPALTITLAIVAVILAVFIYMSRSHRFNGLLWLGIDFAIVGMLVGALILLADMATAMIVKVLETGATVANATVSVLTGDLIISLIILLSAAILSIVGYIILNIFSRQRTDL